MLVFFAFSSLLFLHRGKDLRTQIRALSCVASKGNVRNCRHVLKCRALPLHRQYNWIPPGWYQPQNNQECKMGEPSPGMLPPTRPQEGRLDSWKEIATYLHRDVKTVQRWEKREGM